MILFFSTPLFYFYSYTLLPQFLLVNIWWNFALGWFLLTGGGVLCSGTVRFCFGKRETQKSGARHLKAQHFFQNYSFLIGQGFEFESVIFHSTPTYYKSHPGLSGSPEPSGRPKRLIVTYVPVHTSKASWSIEGYGTATIVIMSQWRFIMTTLLPWEVDLTYLYYFGFETENYFR